MKQRRPLRVFAGLLVLGAIFGCEKPLEPVAAQQPSRAAVLPDYQPVAARLEQLPGESWVEVGTRLLALGDPVLAEQAFIRSINEEGVTAENLTGVAIAAEQQGQVTRAVRYFRAARKRVPDSVLANNNLGVALYRQGEYHAAKQAFQAAFALSDGKSGVAAHNLALSEAAIAREAEANPSELPPKDDLVRLGSGSYQLVVNDTSSIAAQQ